MLNHTKGLDDLWALAVKERDEYIDQIDNSVGTEAHHIFRRASSILNRYDMMNGITLGTKNHALAHNATKKEFSEKIKKYIGESVYLFLEEQQNVSGIPIGIHAWYGGDFYEYKHAELSEYVNTKTIQDYTKKDLISAILLYPGKNFSLSYVSSMQIGKRIQEYLSCMDIKNALMIDINIQYDTLRILGKNSAGILISLCEFPIHGLPEKELEEIISIC